MEEEDTSTRMGFFMKGIGTWEIKEEQDSISMAMEYTWVSVIQDFDMVIMLVN